ncbi:hypothetical protein [Chryseobacterium limigenitum]|uniref:Lipoprotein n=1 Tax=Chryseobacterium limigenitum TaxID=1612149 RepID=A0A1K2IGE6_9FLAO|nr:hypothetical protein [Chryseobacterium limigenitum]SFZ91320.1 hypothetical protein SAMN05216324_102301 [Chryseobacterium limigenitum]
MKNKSIIRLLLLAVFSIFLYSCMNEDLYSSSEKEKQEIQSKSLWKEDMVFINNVKEIFLKNASLESFKNNHGGLPQWEYAMTFGNFDESYLMVPVFGEDKVTGVVTVKRIEDRVYFKFSKDEKAKSFFTHLISSENKKLTPVKEIAENAKIVCTSRTYLFCFPNNDGTQDCYPQVVVKCISEDSFEDNDMGGDNSGDDGLPYGGGSGGNTNPQQNQNPCTKALASITGANTIYKNTNVKQKMDAILKGKIEAQNEWSVALGKTASGIEVTNAVEGIPGQNSVGIPVSQLQNPFIGDGHSHKGARGNPSGGDLYEMIKGLLTQPDFKYRFVYGNNNGTPEVYALIINNPSLALAFLSQYPESENCNNTNEDHTIKRDSPIGLEFYKAFYHYSEGRSDDTSGENYEPRAVAMAHILEKFNIGMSIANVDANGNLKKINTKVEQITVPGSGGAVKEGVTVSKCP